MNDETAMTRAAGRAPAPKAATKAAAKATTRAKASDVAEVQALLADMRQQVDEAAVEIERLTAELDRRTRSLDESEAVTDTVFGMVDTAVLVVGADRRVRAMSRGAAGLLGLAGPLVGKPLSTVAPDDVVEAVHTEPEAAGGGTRPSPVVAGDLEVTTTGVAGSFVVILRRP